MPLEVNEIDIRMRVGEKPEEIKNKDIQIESSGCGNPDYEAIVSECTRRVLQRVMSAQER